jgi:hypothetical protein
MISWAMMSGTIYGKWFLTPLFPLGGDQAEPLVIILRRSLAVPTRLSGKPDCGFAHMSRPTTLGTTVP